MQAAASRIQEAQSAEAQAKAVADSAQATAEDRDEEAATLRRSLAELQGALSGQQDLEVGFGQLSLVLISRALWTRAMLSALPEIHSSEERSL